MYRCPGGKRRVAARIVDQIMKQRPFTSYCEPFAATGAVCLALLKTAGKTVEKVWLNDLDKGTFALWWSVLNEPNEFLRLVDKFEPSRRAFFQFKNELLGGAEFSLPELAFRKVAVHQMSFSGLGVMAGGAMTAVASRWSPRHIRKNVEEARRLLVDREVTITNRDYKAVLLDLDADTFVFADPPYHFQGSVLYRHAFTEQDHCELRSLLAEAKFPWLLSYDDCPQVRKMYRDDTVVELPMTYTIHGISKKRELLITPKYHTTMKQEIGTTLPFARWPVLLRESGQSAIFGGFGRGGLMAMFPRSKRCRIERFGDCSRFAD
jgi:DNA adenine methylase